MFYSMCYYFYFQASRGARRQWRWRPRWSVWLHHHAEPHRTKGKILRRPLPTVSSGFCDVCRHRAQGVQCVEQVKELILDQCEKCSGRVAAEQLEQILGDTAKPVGLLLSERFVNVPPQIALPLHKQLQWVAALSPDYITWMGMGWGCNVKMSLNFGRKTYKWKMFFFLAGKGIHKISITIFFEWRNKMIQIKCSNCFYFDREEISEAERTNKPSGKYHYCLMISKTCKEAGKGIPAPKNEYTFINAEEEFFYEVLKTRRGLTCKCSRLAIFFFSACELSSIPPWKNYFVDS